MGTTPVGRPGDRVLRLATRGSPLARHQATTVETLLREAEAGLAVEQLVVQTRGEVLPDVPLAQIGGQGAFVKEVQAAVLDGRADVAVHSAKDLPSFTPRGLRLVAVPPRADPHDALVGRPLAGLDPGALVATGSARRRAQLAGVRPDLTFVELRGNMAARVGRAGTGAVAAVLVAVAALDRLGWSDRVAEVLAPSVMLPQVGQGALALECREDDEETVERLLRLDDEASHRALTAERAFLAGIGGSCTLPVAAWAEPRPAGGHRLRGMLASGDGRIQVRAAQDVGATDDPSAVGAALAWRLLWEGGGSSIEGLTPPALAASTPATPSSR